MLWSDVFNWLEVRADIIRLVAARTHFSGLITMPDGALRAPRLSLLLIYPPKLSLRPELGPPGAYIFQLG
jgi:hypothetical protein